MTVADLLHRYLLENTANKRGEKIEQYRIHHFLGCPLASIHLNNINRQAVIKYRDDRLLEVKSGTVHRELNILRHCFEVARKEWGISLKTNPVSEITMPSPGRPRDRRVTEAELSALNLACSHPILWPIITIAIETAMRRGEIVAMQWDHINWDKGTLDIPDTKNGYPRTIPLTPRAIEVLRELPQTDTSVMAITGNAIRLAWERLKKKAGVTDLRFHDLRHEAISRFFEMGLSVPEVALISGHRDPRMLFRYTHLRAEEVGKKLKTWNWP
jgi:integrase